VSAWRDGLRLTDVIGSIDELRPDADPNYLLIRRELPPDRRVAILSADLSAALRAPGSSANVVLSPRDRAVLHQRIESRFDAMLEAGFMEEVRRLRELPQLRAIDRPLDLPAIRAVGYRQAWEYLDGALPETEFRDRAIFATRQLAKRQLTWLRGERDARWFDPLADHQALEAALALFLPPNLRTG
jgi:tRNA dimethylallyltransferase